VFHLRPLGNRGWPVGARQHRHQSDDDHTDQGMLEIDRGTRVLQLPEMPYDLVQTDTLNVRHRSHSVLRRAVLPSTGRTGWFTPVAPAALARNDCSQFTKQA